MKVALVIPTYNRPEYVKRCYASLVKLTTQPDYIMVVDDCSTVKMPKLKLPNAQAYSTPYNSGVKYALTCVIDKAIVTGADVVINLDSDAIVSPDFVDVLVKLHSKTGLICSGFNNPKVPFVKQHNGYGIKRNANGINMCFNKSQYLNYIRPSLISNTKDWDLHASSRIKEFAITKPSCVQHIGEVSSMGHYPADVALDFNNTHK